MDLFHFKVVPGNVWAGIVSGEDLIAASKIVSTYSPGFHLQSTNSFFSSDFSQYHLFIISLFLLKIF